jgi:uncharacterized protein involved in exopolysaccharide biosynthesis
LLAGSMGLGGVVGVAYAVLAAPEFVAKSSFTVADARSSGGVGLSALAGLGGSLAALTGPTTTQFLRAALSSREVLEGVVTQPLPVMPDALRRSRLDPVPSRIDLFDWYRVRTEDPALSLEDALRALRDAMKTTVSDRTGIITLEVRDRNPRVAASIARALVDGLNRFNLQTRQSSSHANRQFLERRVVEAQQELREVEDRMRDFLAGNRRIADSPNLQFEQGRLQRQIAVRQQVYLALAQDLEQARIDEVKDTPVLTVIEPAVPPARRSWPRRSLLVIVWTITGGIVGVGLAYLLEWIREMDRTSPPSWTELMARLGLRRRPEGTS